MLSTLLFGLAPALQASRTNLVAGLKSAVVNSSSKSRLWGRNVLVVAQVSLSLVLTVVAAMLFHGLHIQVENGPGYRTDHLAMMSFDPSIVRYSDLQTQQFYQQLTERTHAMPEVKSATLSEVVPMGGTQDEKNIVPEGYPLPKDRTSVTVFADVVDDEFFTTMAVPIVDGRSFSKNDSAKAPRVAVVNEVLAQHYWPNQNVIGKRFRLNDAKGELVEIIGIAKTSKYLWFGEAPVEYLYLPLSQNPQPRMTLLAQSSVDAASLISGLQVVVGDGEVVRGLDANQPIYDVRTMRDFYQIRAISTPDMINEIVGAMGLIGLLLALVGLSGLVSYSVARRTREIGIRIAVGANQTSVVRMVLRQGLVLVAIGLALGLVGSFIAEIGVKAVFSSTERDPLVYLTVVPAVLLVAMLAAWVPARRAARVNPTSILRYE